MKKAININFQGRVIPIEESAFDILKQYVESLRAFFSNEEGCDEIINDIEGRIAELFGETLKKGSTCITEDDVNTIIASMGKPEDFDDDEAKVKSKLSGEQETKSSSTSEQSFTSRDAKHFYRDENHKVLGGVCSGIGNYFGIDPVLVRVLFVIFSWVTFIPYIIFWVVTPGTSTVVIGSQRKRMFRDPDDKLIAGICSGLSQYFGINVWIPRVLFLLPFFSFAFRLTHVWWWSFPHFLSWSFSPGSLVIYTILWLVLPEAKTAADKLQLKGEKVDLTNIKNTIQGDLQGFKERVFDGKTVNQAADQFASQVKEKAQQFSSEVNNATRRHSRGLGDIIALIAKIFAYFILGSLLLGVVCALFGLGVVVTGLLPMRSFVIADNGWENIFVWGTLILFLWVPVIGIITAIIRRLAKMKNNNALRYSFLSLWLIGVACLIGLISSLYHDFRFKNYPTEQQIAFNSTNVDRLEVKALPLSKYYEDNWFRIEPFNTFDEDTIYVRNVWVRVTRSNNDSFHVSMAKMARGETREKADDLASKIDYTVTQKDSMLILDKGVGINRQDKFRNQHIVVTIAVPVGKKIFINNNVGWSDNVHIGNDRSFDSWDNEDGKYNFKHNVEYIMTEKGLRRTDRKITDDDYNNDDENSDNLNDKIRRAQKSRQDLQNELDKKQREEERIKQELDKLKDTTHQKPINTQPSKPAKPTAMKNNNVDNLLMMKFFM